MATHLTFYLFTLGLWVCVCVRVVVESAVAFLFGVRTYRYLEIYELLGGKGKIKTKCKRTSERKQAET